MNGERPNRGGLARRESWPVYLAAVATETAYVLALAATALLLAVIVEAVL